jgi:single-strand DNA-binding protein
MNKVILVGRLTADPELRQTQSGVASCKFNIAVNRKFADKDTGERQADFISCQAWRQTAEFICRYFSKGKMIAIEGNLRTGKYQDKNHSDVTHYTTDVFVDSVEFVGGKNENGGQSQTSTSSEKSTSYSSGSVEEYEEILSDDDMPF